MQTLHFQEHYFEEYKTFQSLQLIDSEESISSITLLEQLQTTLDVNQLLNIFAMEAAKYANFSGLYFKSPLITTSIRGSKPSKQERQFNLKLNNQFLGTLTYALNAPISLANFKILSSLHQFLLYPLRNALQYYQVTLLARKDGLTGLGNRRYFDEQLTRAMHNANRHQTKVGLILGDLNQFKQLNDTYGHPLGDQVLKEVAKELTASIRDSDCVFRFGGDEFALLVEHASDNSLTLIKQRIHDRIAKNPLLAKHQVTCSLGSTFMQRDDTEKSFFERADQALYREKMARKKQLIQG